MSKYKKKRKMRPVMSVLHQLPMVNYTSHSHIPGPYSQPFSHSYSPIIDQQFTVPSLIYPTSYIQPVNTHIFPSYPAQHTSHPLWQPQSSYICASPVPHHSFHSPSSCLHLQVTTFPPSTLPPTTSALDLPPARPPNVISPQTTPAQSASTPTPISPKQSTPFPSSSPPPFDVDINRHDNDDTDDDTIGNNNDTESNSAHSASFSLPLLDDEDNDNVDTDDDSNSIMEDDDDSDDAGTYGNNVSNVNGHLQEEVILISDEDEEVDNENAALDGKPAVSDACCICTDVIAEEQKYISSCKHSYCILCILQWAEENPTCPQCRECISVEDILCKLR